MALSYNPWVLITDEPTTALDVLIKAKNLDFLENLKREAGLSIIPITFDLGIFAKVAKAIWTMYSGKIIESGPVNLLFQSSLHSYTKGALNSLPKPSSSFKNCERLSEIDGNVPSLSHLPLGRPFHPRCPSVI